MSTRRKHILPIVLGIVGLAGAANASSTFVTGDNLGTALQVFGISAFQTTGNDMAGLLVTVTFDNNPLTTSQAVWAAGGGSSGSATNTITGGGTWTLAETGDTGFVSDSTNVDGSALNFWTLTNTSTVHAISSVQLLGFVNAAGGVVFDRNLSTVGTPLVGLQSGTPGSSIGITFSNTSINTPPADSASYSVTAQYFNIVQFFPPSQNCQGAGFTPKTTIAGCGDTWQGLTLSFSGTSFIQVGGTAATFHFFQDTDQVALPEPLSLGLVGFGLLAIAGFRRRRAN